MMFSQPCVFQPDGEDDLKKRQLMELAIMNGTYRDAKLFHPAHFARKSWFPVSLTCLVAGSSTQVTSYLPVSNPKPCTRLFLQPDGEDDLKKRQLMELAIINGTYRDTTRPPPSPSQSALAGRKCCLDFCSHPHSCVSVMIWLPPFCAACLAAAHTWLFSLLLVAQFFPSYHGCARGGLQCCFYMRESC